MRLLRVHVINADTCGGLLDGLNLTLRKDTSSKNVFDPICLIGPNGAGKSELLQVIAEIFQSIFHAAVSSQERIEGNPNLMFEIEYLIEAHSRPDIHVRIYRTPEKGRKAKIVIQQKQNSDWISCDIDSPETVHLLPKKVVGYTSGDNETLSLPFLLSRSGYAEEVRTRALQEIETESEIPDTRLMLIDYGTHLEVLVANLLLSNLEQRAALLAEGRLDHLHSFRCVIQLAHSAVPKVPARLKGRSKRKGIQLTNELERYLDQLKRCSTCYSYESKSETYIFDFLVNECTIEAFGAFWKDAIDLYSSFHKLSMLNDLAIPKATRDRFKKDTRERRFASRLPEPQDEHKVFRFERVNFHSQASDQIVDYVSLSDGEHQLAQILGTFSMLSFADVLFLLDEPESHFNPQWRVKFISKLLDLPTPCGRRRESSIASKQDALLTTHAPFVPSDMRRERLQIFGKEEGKIIVKQPDIETFGTTFDAILDECFDIRPPISAEPRKEIARLEQSNSADEIRKGIEELGASVEKAFLTDHLREVLERES